ncbi:prepilin-type N-terminal cleavage/methylation domain-containing protein [Pseudovibrio denitrificans]|uniref:Prepilin-type N-terminal cleavage/methylation domain-containing protein n=1 Tax=Pseudovibrio denitrificans TaxID=258256 RepID=A0A1I7DZV7_9HYPH|nr:prepilin-type N-terminal cleavage/methylation domain-containing protein [Pseudovibrio denitrificans]SFU17201.1 prepilin-type N-terminal cleavage/methylation domain-containing protein [Pseudovibrio denitrificans]
MIRSKAGFAMVELLVALAILLVISAGISGTLSFGKRVWQRTETISQNSNEVSQLQTLRSYISRAQNINVSGSRGGEPTQFFVGEANSLSFLSYTKAEQGFIAPFILEIKASESTERVTIKMSSLDEKASHLPINLLSDVESVKFRYAKRELKKTVSIGDNFSWFSEWKGQNQLPDLVELSIVSTDAQSEPHLRLLIRPVLR